MTAVTELELDAKLETLETKMDARVDGIRNLIDGFFIRAEERDKAAEQRFKAMDRRFAHIDERFVQIDARFTEVNARSDHHWQAINTRVDDLSHEMKEVKQGLSTQRYWMVGTGVAMLLGVAALNATGQSNMVAAFESGNTVSAAIVRNANDIERLRHGDVRREDSHATDR